MEKQKYSLMAKLTIDRVRSQVKEANSPLPAQQLVARLGQAQKGYLALEALASNPNPSDTPEAHVK